MKPYYKSLDKYLYPSEADTIIAELQEKVLRLQRWVADLHSGMYINCVYCGHRYGPENEVPATMADVLKEHVEQCPEHPMSKLKLENEVLKEVLRQIDEQCGYIDVVTMITDQKRKAREEIGK